MSGVKDRSVDYVAMVIRVSDSLIKHMKDRRDGFALQVTGEGDSARLLRGLEQARLGILALGRSSDIDGGLRSDDFAGPKYVSEVMPSRQGPIIVIDASHTSDDLLQQIPTVIRERLNEQGVTEGSIAAPPVDERLVHLGGPAVTLHAVAFPPNPGAARSPLPTSWLDPAVEWLDMAPGDEAWLTAAFHFPIDRGSIRDLLDRFSTTGNPAVFVGDLWQRARGIGVRTGEGLLTLGLAGSSYVDDSGFYSGAEELKTIARQLDPPAAYACLQVRPTFEIWLRLLERRFEENGAPMELLAACIDEFVPDAFPWQLLNPGHLARLGHRADTVTVTRNGFAELELAPISAALADPDALAELRRRGKQVLMPALLSSEQVQSEVQRRWTTPGQ